MEKVWLDKYPKGVPAEIDRGHFNSISDIFTHAIQSFPERIAFTNLGVDITFKQLDLLSDGVAHYLQADLGLKKGDCLALQMPNLLQFPIALFAAFKIGLKVTNINPLYTPREMQHQLNDAEAKAIVILDNFASKLEEILPQTQIEHIIITKLADLCPFPKKQIVNFVVKNIKKMVPDYHLPQAVSYSQIVKKSMDKKPQKIECLPEDTAFLQYTGGTTGVSKGAELTHLNIVYNSLQIGEWMKPLLTEKGEIVISPLPLYHIFSLTVNCIGFLMIGARNILITNPRDIPAFVKEIGKYPFTVMTGLNTLYNALLNNEDFAQLDFSSLKISVGGGMAMQKVVVEKWHKVTGTKIVEGYGLTESSPLLCCNPVDGKERVGYIGLPVSSTLIKIVDDDGNEVGFDTPGEIWAKGPQIMKGYWKRPEETQTALTPDGWLRTGDVGFVEKDGFVKIVDRKKDMILVSGFNVFPNEVEDIIACYKKVLEVAVIGVPDEKSGEVVKAYVVKKDQSLSKDELTRYCRENLTAYKVPKFFEFKEELPKSNVGKVLRRLLKEEQ